MSFEVSVIIPTYNAGSIIEKTIKSLINQSFKDFEIIFVDDNS
ncbi:glycosyltransferase family 2 protein, partial [uncultured Methanobrevibacter sp.]